MAFRAIMSSKIPVVIIVGATGTGKTKLSVSLAQKFKTEVISADSMQIYRGLDVATAKASPAERAAVTHHLLDILEPHQYFTVVDFRSRALSIIENLSQEGKVPIIVGGTNYYIESIVYQILVENMDDPDSLIWDKSRRKRDFEESKTDDDESTRDNKVSKTNNAEDTEHDQPNVDEGDPDLAALKANLQNDVDNEKKFSNEEIHEKLKSIDPSMADRLHPNNRRKILRAIEVWLKTGRKQSELLAEQKNFEGKLRRPGSTIMLWLTCDQKVHDERLNSRVDSMLQEGLIAELLDFHARHNRQRLIDGNDPDYTKGVFQTLGFKEFHEYLMLSEEAKASEGGRKLLEVSIDNMKMATRRYARRQNKMIKGRFLEHPNREVPLIYKLDTTDLSKWDEEVEEKAIHIVESYLTGVPCKYDPVQSQITEAKKSIDGNSRNYCDVCERVIIGDKTFQIHLESFRHKRVLKKKKFNENKVGEPTEVNSTST